jgi:hypothetical protein
MAKNGENAGEQQLLPAVDDRELIAQITDQGLRHGAANRRHARSSRACGAPSTVHIWFQQYLLSSCILSKINCERPEAQNIMAW